MKVLIEITHPAHAHFFREPMALLLADGHELMVTSRQKDCTLELLDGLGVQHERLSGQMRKGLAGMAGELLVRNRELARVVRSFRPDVLAGVGGTSAAQVGFLLRRPAVVFYDTEEARLQNLLTYPFARRVVVPKCYTGWVPARRTKRYRGYHELSYLHPDRFEANRNVAIANGLAAEGDTFLIRLVSWQANHDIGLGGWSVAALERVIAMLTRRGRVLISAESGLPEQFARFAYAGRPEAIHHVLAHCRLFAGESATMTSEAVVMGVPAIYAAPSFRSYVSEQQQRYGLAEFVAEPTADSVEAAILRLLAIDQAEVTRRHQRLLDECTDVADMVHASIAAIGSGRG